MNQQTLKNKITVKGIGLHSGVSVNLNINPALENSGIVFRRVDLADTPDIPALYSNVTDTRNCTSLGKVSTIEHLMSALYMTGIDNALIEVDNLEIPIMDSSAKVFYDELKAASKIVQSAPRKFLRIKKEVRFEDEKGNFAELKPIADNTLKIDFEIDFPSPVVGNQRFNQTINKDIFEQEISMCRTFCEKSQVDYLQSLGLIKGGSLENAVVLDGDSILNPEGFRCQNECVNHKVLDAIGDLYTSGYHILGELKASRTGHYHTNELLKKLFANPDNYEMV